MRFRIVEEFMREGVTIVSPQTTFINYGSSVGKDTVIYPFTFIESGVRVGENCSMVSISVGNSRDSLSVIF